MNLTELLLALTLLGLLSTLAVPGSRRALDSIQVRAAREAAYGVGIRTRSLAMARGGADFVIDTDTDCVSVVDSEGTLVLSTSLRQFGVDMSVDAGPRQVRLRYDAHGLGRMTSRTIHFQRGDAEAGLTVSAYGRIRRW